MEIVSEELSGACIVRLPSRLVMGNSDTIRAEIKRLIDAGNHQLILDLSEVEFVDSSGLSVLVFALKSVRSLNGEAVILHPSDNVLSLIELTRLHEVFAIFMDQDSAVREMSMPETVA